MVSSAAQSGTRGGSQASRNETSGLLWFAAVLLIILAFFNGLDGIAAINRSHVFVSNAHYVFGDLRAWGWTILALAVLQLAAAIAVLSGKAWGRWVGVGVLGLNAFAQMFFLSAYPFWSLIIIGIDIVAIYGLCVYGSRNEARY